MKKLGLVLLIAVLALIVVGCGGVVPQNISGRGTVQLFDGDIAGGTFILGEATFSLNFACYAQNNNRLEGKLTWNDPTNGVRISAILPETSVRAFTGGQYTTCKALKAAAATLDVSVNVAGIYSEDGNANGDAGTQTGMVGILVTKPGAPLPGDPPYYPCGTEGTFVAIAEQTQEGFVYEAMGCLDRGKITWGATQNQQ
ncbi:MAG: hypothetical protein HZB51_29215 [Chloroflexi bacterium]|nr:hypothetical protein [Chloroflexota bacterium]